MPRRLDSRSLSLFLAVADAASVRQAAERLHLTQPPLSRAIQELEQRLGCRLFDRQVDGMTLTAAGRALRPYALRMERLLREAEQAMAARVAPGRLRLGLTSAVEPPWFGPLVERARAHFEGVTLSIVSDSSPRLVRQMRAGRLDAACIALPTKVGEPQAQEIDALPMRVAVSTRNPLARRRVLRLASLASSPVFWFQRARQPAFYDHCEQVFARHGFASRRLPEPVDFHVLLAQVAADAGVALVPASFAAVRRTGVVYRALAEGDELAVRIGLVAPADRAALRAILLELIGQVRHGRARPAAKHSLQ